MSGILQHPWIFELTCKFLAVVFLDSHQSYAIMSGEQSMSLEETNRVRVSLGLAPLADEGAGESADLSDDPDALAEANYTQRRKEQAQERAVKETKERIAKAKNQRDLRAKLLGKGLGEAEIGVHSSSKEGQASAAEWVKQSRRRAKEKAAELQKLRQREKELEDRDNEAVYGEDDLTGLRVRHGLDDFAEGENVILTLADRRILDDEGML